MIRGRRSAAAVAITSAMILGAVFLTLKLTEYQFVGASGITCATNDFYLHYFSLAGLHLSHAVVGLGVLLVVQLQTRHDGFGATRKNVIESGACFWHLVDLLWIVLFAATPVSFAVGAEQGGGALPVPVILAINAARRCGPRMNRPLAYDDVGLDTELMKGTERQMDLKLQKGAAWCGASWLVLFFGGLLGFAGLIPPLSPGWSANEIGTYFADNQLWVQIGLAIGILVYFVALPFMAMVCLRVRHVEGKFGILTMCQVFSGILFVPGGAYPLVFLAAAAYRTDRSPQITQALNDTFWLMFMGVVGGLLVQAIVLALATFCYPDGPQPFPRWYGYLNAWYVLLTVPASVVMLFHAGPLAWNGVFAFWVPAGAFGMWLGGTTVTMLRSIAAEQEADRALPAELAAP